MPKNELEREKKNGGEFNEFVHRSAASYDPNVPFTDK